MTSCSETSVKLLHVAACNRPMTNVILQAWQPWASAALTCGGMSAGGDIAAQSLVRWQLQRERKRPPRFEAVRTARMFAFGLLWYGPFQHWWYGALARKFPGTALTSFLPKVALNQVVLGPLVLSTAFAWNFACTQRLRELRGSWSVTLRRRW